MDLGSPLDPRLATVGRFLNDFGDSIEGMGPRVVYAWFGDGNGTGNQCSDEHPVKLWFLLDVPFLVKLGFLILGEGLGPNFGNLFDTLGDGLVVLVVWVEF